MRREHELGSQGSEPVSQRPQPVNGDAAKQLGPKGQRAIFFLSQEVANDQGAALFIPVDELIKLVLLAGRVKVKDLPAEKLVALFQLDIQGAAQLLDLPRS